MLLKSKGSAKPLLDGSQHGIQKNIKPTFSIFENNYWKKLGLLPFVWIAFFTPILDLLQLSVLTGEVGVGKSSREKQGPIDTKARQEADARRAAKEASRQEKGEEPSSNAKDATMAKYVDISDPEENKDVNGEMAVFKPVMPIFDKLGLLKGLIANFNFWTLWARSFEAEEFVMSLIVVGSSKESRPALCGRRVWKWETRSERG
jgi:hypothetical protein